MQKLTTDLLEHSKLSKPLCQLFILAQLEKESLKITDLNNRSAISGFDIGERTVLRYIDEFREVYNLNIKVVKHQYHLPENIRAVQAAVLQLLSKLLQEDNHICHLYGAIHPASLQLSLGKVKHLAGFYYDMLCIISQNNQIAIKYRPSTLETVKKIKSRRRTADRVEVTILPRYLVFINNHALLLAEYKNSEQELVLRQYDIDGLISYDVQEYQKPLLPIDLNSIYENSFNHWIGDIADPVTLVEIDLATDKQVSSNELTVNGYSELIQYVVASKGRFKLKGASSQWFEQFAAHGIDATRYCLPETDP